MKKKTQVKFKGKGYNTSAKLIEEYKELHGPGIYAFRTVCSPTISTTGQAYKDELLRIMTEQVSDDTFIVSST